MKVVCRKVSLSDEQNMLVGFEKGAAHSFELTIGREYTALGLSFQSSSIWNKGVIVLIRDNIGRCAFVPVCLLDISNNKVSGHWVARKIGDYNFCLWPNEFFDEYFHDDLSNGDNSVVEKFDRICQLMDGEI